MNKENRMRQISKTQADYELILIIYWKIWSYCLLQIIYFA